MSDKKTNIETEQTSSITRDKSIGVTEDEAFVFSNKELKKFKDEEEQRLQEQKKRLFKIGSLLIFAMVMFIFASIAWFTMSKEVGNDGMGVTMVGDLFSIVPLDSPAHVGIYDDEDKSGTYVRDILLSKADKEDDIITWTITDDVATTVTESGTTTTTVTKGKNIGNGPAEGFEGGISPGASGEIQFIIKPNQPVNAEFSFFIYAYTGGYNALGDEDKTELKLIGSGSGIAADAIIADKLLNGHLLLFSDIDENTGKYYGLIDSDSDFKRVMTRAYSNETVVSLYWIWPETLAELILDENSSDQIRNMRGKKNICTSEGRTEVISFFKSHAEWFLLDPMDLDHDWSDVFNSTISNSIVINTVNNNYSLYSSYYNEADQCIGTNISYILLDMTAGGEAMAETGSSTTSGTGSGSGQ